MYAEPITANIAAHPIKYEYGKSYIFYSILEDKLIISTKLPGLRDKIKGKIKDTIYGSYIDYDGLQNLIEDHYRIEWENRIAISLYSPGCLRSVNYKNNFGLVISWYSDLEYIGEL